MIRFRCNVCSQSDECPEESFAREGATCSGCGSTARFRVLMHLLSVELFGLDLTLEQFPRLKSIRGLGLSDWRGSAKSRGHGPSAGTRTRIHHPPGRPASQQQPRPRRPDWPSCGSRG
jgi:hypothetical protein